MSVFGIIIAVLIIVLVIMLVRYLLTDPYTLQDIQSGKTQTVIQSTSLATNGSNVPSSNFAYSVWFYINDWNYNYGKPKVLFGRMGAPSDPSGGSITGVSGLDPCPAVVLGNIENNLSISLGCYPGADQRPTRPGGRTVMHTCNVSNVPIQKWVNLVISVYGRTLDVYIDGKLVKTCLLPGIANINNSSSVYLTPMGGFDGWTAKFQYFPDSLNPQEVWNIYTQGYSRYTFGMFGKLLSLNPYQVKISLLENGTTTGTFTF